MVEQVEMLGTEIFNYEDMSEFVDTLSESGTARLHTFTNGGLFGIGASYTAVFLDDKGTIHCFMTPDLEELREKVKPLYDLIEEKGIPEVDGTFRVSQRNGDIYQLFQTDRPDNEEAVQASYDTWVEAVKSLSPKETLIQYIPEENMAVIDATKGKEHFVTILDGESSRTLEATLDLLMRHGEYKTRDNTSVINWYKDMRNE